MSDWGQGSKNNNIGWGQGAVNNSISWGLSHSESWAGDTDILGEVIDNRLIFSVKTDNAGTSATNQFTIPTTGTGYLYDIETSDGQSTTGLTGGTTITFPSAGTYDVYISGSFPQFYFNNAGDRLKLINLKNFGIYAQGSTSQVNAFYGCSNMVISATDIGHFENVTNFSFAWRGCSSLTSFPLLDTSSGTNFSFAWQGCNKLTSFPLLDTSSGTNFSSAWSDCTLLTSFPLIDTSLGTDFSAAWNRCSSLTSFPLIDTSSGTNFSNAWSVCSSLTSFSLIDTSNGTIFAYAWYGCSSLTSFPLLDTSLGTNFAYAWSDCSSLTSFPANAFDTNIASNYASSFTSTKLSTQSIDDILISLDASGVINGTFNQSGGGNLPSAVGLAAKANLISKGWTITTN